MYQISAYRLNDNCSIKQSSVKRGWMEETSNRHAYNCFPVSITNSLGWSISFPEDISFIWNGISDSNKDNIKVLTGEKYVSTARANATLSFNTGIVFETEENFSMMAMPVPNEFNPDFQIFTTIITSSFFSGEFPVVARVLSPNKVITIKANTPVANILPISLTELQNSEILFSKTRIKTEPYCNPTFAAETRKSIWESGKWTNFYRDAINPCGDTIGKHEVKAIRLGVKEQ
jgi:hypothetical protein